MANPILRILRKIRGNDGDVTYLEPLSKMSGDDSSENTAHINFSLAESA